MHYNNSEKQNNEYYTAYKKEMNKEEYIESSYSFKTFIKLGLVILFLGLLAISLVYFINHFSTETKIIEKELRTIKLSKPELPQSVQLRESSSQTPQELKFVATDTTVKHPKVNLETRKIVNNVMKSVENSRINPKDVALIVEIIMSQTNNKKTTTLEKELIAAEELNTTIKKTLKEKNYYNKIVVSRKDNNLHKSNTLVKLNNDLNKILETPSSLSNKDSYTIAINKEVSVRSNAMRVIVVQKGDTLSKLAQKAYGNKDDYARILTANPEVIKNPNKIFVGQKLRIPS